MINKSDSAESKKEGAIKMSYRSPRFSIYGGIRDLTKNVGNAGSLDGGAGMMQRSRP